MTTLKVRPIGNSLGVVLPKEVVARLNVKDEDALFLTQAPDGSMRLTPYDPAFEAKSARASAWVGSGTRCANSQVSGPVWVLRSVIDAVHDMQLAEHGGARRSWRRISFLR